MLKHSEVINTPPDPYLGLKGPAEEIVTRIGEKAVNKSLLLGPATQPNREVVEEINATTLPPLIL